MHYPNNQRRISNCPIRIRPICPTTPLLDRITSHYKFCWSDSPQHSFGNFLRSNIQFAPMPQSKASISQIYSYVRCIIRSEHVHDGDFKVAATQYQIQPSNYSSNNINAAYPEHSFDQQQPITALEQDSIAKNNGIASRDDRHLKRTALICITSCENVLAAIATNSFQDEVFAHSSYDSPTHDEHSNCHKFLTLQSEQTGYSLVPPTEPRSP